MKTRALMLAGVLVLAGCGSDERADDASDEATETTAASTDAATETTTATTETTGAESTEPATGGDLVGQWETTARSIFEAAAATYGAGPGMTCDGPFVVTFSADGTFSTDLNATCSLNDITATATATLSGTYVTDGSTFTVTASEGSGTMNVNGIEQPMPVLDGYRQGVSKPVSYTVDGDTLSYTFTSDDGNTWAQTLTRVG